LNIRDKPFNPSGVLNRTSVFTAVIAQHVKGVFATLISALFLSTSVPAPDWWERSFGRHTIALIVQSISLLYVVEFPGFMCMVRNRCNRVFHFLSPSSVFCTIMNMNVKAGLLCGIICVVAYWVCFGKPTDTKEEPSSSSYIALVTAFAVGMIAGALWFASNDAVVAGGGGCGESATIAAMMQEIDVCDPCF
jgi:hypothetical protein